MSMVLIRLEARRKCQEVNHDDASMFWNASKSQAARLRNFALVTRETRLEEGSAMIRKGSFRYDGLAYRLLKTSRPVACAAIQLS